MAAKDSFDDFSSPSPSCFCLTEEVVGVGPERIFLLLPELLVMDLSLMLMLFSLSERESALPLFLPEFENESDESAVAEALDERPLSISVVSSSCACFRSSALRGLPDFLLPRLMFLLNLFYVK